MATVRGGVTLLYAELLREELPLAGSILYMASVFPLHPCFVGTAKTEQVGACFARPSLLAFGNCRVSNRFMFHT